MIPKPARYLLRVDDLCPEAHTENWARIRGLIEKYGIRAILAVVPANQDPKLIVSRSDAKFWEQLRAMESAGATVAMHGYRHLCASRGESLLGLHRRSEFAGVSEAEQQAWIHAGLAILREHGLNPGLFVAPRHGFDQATLRALREEKLAMISDGFSRMPFVRAGVTWIPQQIWEPVRKTRGLWTICIHPNSTEGISLARLDEFLGRQGAAFTSVQRVLEEMQPGELPLTEQIYERVALARARFRSARRRIRQAEIEDV